MKSSPSLCLSLLMASVTLLLSGCAGSLLSIGPKAQEIGMERQTKDGWQRQTRAHVLKECGQPVKTAVFSPPRPAGWFAARKYPAFSGYKGSRPELVGRIDEFVIKGHIENSKDSGAVGGLAMITGGVTDILFLPVAIADLIDSAGDVHHLHVAYTPKDEVLRARLEKVK